MGHRHSPHVPDRAQVVVVGGGVIGISVAYHLALLGWTDVVVVERDRLTSGTTWHAAGLMTCFGSLSATSLWMRLYTRELYATLERETGLSTGFAPVGFIEIASDEGRLEEYRRVAAFNRFLGLEVHEIGPRDVGDLFPLAKVDDVLRGFYVPGDGRVNPVDATMSLARGARMLGVQIVEGLPVTDVRVRSGRVCGVASAAGDIECEYVVNCTGMWARQLGERHGVAIPLQAAEHYYLITEPIDGVHGQLPVLEDPARYGYYRTEGDGLMIGLFEAEAAPWNLDAIPDDFSFGQIPPDWDRMGPYVAKAMERIPASVDTGIRTFFCGPESFTPDLAPIIGQAPGIDNYFVAAGMNSVGILTAGGVGRIVAQWMVEGHPDVDVTGINIDRSNEFQLSRAYRAERTVETLGMVYQTHFPGRSLTTARGIKTSPLHSRLVAAGGYFRDVSGWEAPDWYAEPGEVPEVDRLSWGRQSWFGNWEREHRAVREAVGLIDMTFMSKFRVAGPDAGELLEYLSANEVAARVGFITYTQWLNEHGTIEADVTVARLKDEDFLVVASDTCHGHVSAWIRRHAGRARVSITDATASLALLSVQGPLSREVLQQLTTTDMSNSAFGYRTAREITIGSRRALCVRITYVGELGYELYVPVADAPEVYSLIVATGSRYGLTNVGLRALSSLRLEKAYRDYGHDIDNTDTVFEAGLDFAVAFNKKRFIGREAVVRQRSDGLRNRRLVQVLLTDPSPLMHHAEVVHRDGTPVGYVRAASFGHTLGGAVALAMIDAREPLTAEWIASGDWSVDVAGVPYPATASLTPMYDPGGLRVRA